MIRSHAVALLYSLCLALFITACGGSPDPESFEKPLLKPEAAAIDSYFEQQLKTRSIPGLSVAILAEGELLYEGHYGSTQLGSSSSPTAQTAYQLASMSKILTGTLVMLLVEEEQLDLQAPISNYLSDLPETWKSLTLENLLSHTAGLPRIMDAKSGTLISYSPEASYRAAVKQGLQNRPDVTWEYNQLGFVLTQRVVEASTEQSFEAVMQEKLFTPLDMQYSSFDKKKLSGQLPRVYSRTNDKVIDFPKSMDKLYPPLLHAAGGLYSSSADLAKFAAALDGGRLLSQKSKDRMFSPVELEDGALVPYGLGWEIKDIAGVRTAGHSGGQKAVYRHFRKKDFTVIILSNAFGAEPSYMVEKIAKLYGVDR